MSQYVSSISVFEDSPVEGAHGPYLGSILKHPTIENEFVFSPANGLDLIENNLDKEIWSKIQEIKENKSFGS